MRHILKKSGILSLVVAVCLLMSVVNVCAEPHEKNKSAYVNPYLEGVVDILFANGFVDPHDPKQLRDYVFIKDCKLYQEHYKDDFMWNKIRNRIIADSKTLQNELSNRYVLPVRFHVTRYNFNTKAFDIESTSQLRNVNVLPLYSASSGVGCGDDKKLERLEKLPAHYQVRLDVPLSLYRIPMAENMGRKILAALDVNKSNAEVSRIIYGLVYVTVDSVMGVESNYAFLLGRIDRLEFFLDQPRTQRIRTLYYSDL
jgi:hypothetical protein